MNSDTFQQLVLNTDSIILVRMLISEMSSSITISDVVFQKLSEKYNVKYSGGGKEEFMKSIQGLKKIGEIIHYLSRKGKEKKNILQATIADLPESFFLYCEDPYYFYVNFEDDVDSVLAMIDRILSFDTVDKRVIHEFIERTMDTNISYNGIILLKHLIKNDLIEEINSYNSIKIDNKEIHDLFLSCKGEIIV